jgi:hypothetical protein
MTRADGLGELTGHPGTCVSTLAPGATNMVTGVASALLERASLIAITADVAAGAPAGRDICIQRSTLRLADRVEFMLTPAGFFDRKSGADVAPGPYPHC